MSGGHFTFYKFSLNEEVKEEIDYLVSNNGNQELNEFGDKIGKEYNEKVIDKFKLTSMVVGLTMEMIKHIDWLVCGDDSEDSFLLNWKEEVDPLMKKLKETIKD